MDFDGDKNEENCDFVDDIGDGVKWGNKWWYEIVGNYVLILSKC